MRVTDGSAGGESGDGSDRRLCDHAGTGQPGTGRRRALRAATALLRRKAIPVLLGSSQAQVVSDQNGLASIVPSAGNVGPCDVFIAVSAGHSTVQFQMENLAAIVLPPKNIPRKSCRGHREAGGPISEV